MKRFTIAVILLFSICTLSDRLSAGTITNNEKIDAKTLQKINRGDNQLDVIVLLTGYQEDVTAGKADHPARMAASQSLIHSRQSKVLNKIPPSHLKLKHRFKNFPGFSARINQQGIQKMASLSEVVIIEEDGIVEAHLAQGIPLMNALSARSTYDGTGVSVAVVDTGIDYNHPMLGDGGFPNAKVIGGYDFGDNDADPLDCQGHGTSVAGISAGTLASGPGDYIGGVVHNAKLYALKIVSGCNDFAYFSDIIAAWDWAVSHKNDDPANPILVINTSFGGSTRYESACDSSHQSIAAAANNAVANGITLFCSAGNNGFIDGIVPPACVSNSMSVGAVYDADIGQKVYSICTDSTTAADQVTCYSNSANYLDILAPSNDAYTTAVGGGYSGTFGGTSAASPYAAGIAALLQSYVKSTTGFYYSPAGLKERLLDGQLITDHRNSITKPRVKYIVLRYVGSSGSDSGDCTDPSLPCRTIQYAVNQAEDYETVRIAQGTYNENIAITSNISGLLIHGGWSSDFSIRENDSSLTVVDGDITGDGIGDGKVFDIVADGVDIDLTIDGLTIRNGNTSVGGAGVSAYTTNGGVIALVLKNNKITDNSAAYGGGVRIYSESDNASAFTLTDNLIIGNNASDNGGGVVASAPFNPGPVTVNLTNNIIADNSASGNGGGIAIAGITLNLTNNTITGNTAVEGGGVHVFSYSGVTSMADILNTIIWGNTATGSGDDIYLYASGASTTVVNASYSNIGNVVNGPSNPGTYNDLGNNLNTDPLFVDLSNGNYHLSALSPLIDAGTNSDAPQTDIDGNIRPFDGDGNSTATSDVGADEYIPILLISGEPEEGSVAPGEWVYYRISSSDTDTKLEVTLTNLSNDVDLYVRAGVIPTLNEYDCRPYYTGTSEETCTLTNIGAQTWYIGIRGYEAGSYTITAELSVIQHVLFYEGFDDPLTPSGWTIIDNAGTSAQWRFDDPANRGNRTGGFGGFAIADNDFHYFDFMDTELLTPIIDMSGSGTVFLQFKTDFYEECCYSNEIAEIDISINGAGGPWANVWKKTSDYRGPKTEVVDITAIAASQSNVMIRFHYYNDDDGYWWQMDDVIVAEGACIVNIYFRDSDGDGYGDPNVAIQACVQPDGYLTNNYDCDDTNEAINPYATEICDETDNNCDGQVDEHTCIGDIYVEPNDICNNNAPCFATIQEGIIAAGDGTTIKVAQGTYHENLLITSSIDGLLIQGGWSSDFSTRAEEPSLTVVDGDTTGDGIGDGDVIYIMEDAGYGYNNSFYIDMDIENFTITNGNNGIFFWSFSGNTGAITLNLIGNMITENSNRGIDVLINHWTSGTLMTLNLNVNGNEIAGNHNGGIIATAGRVSSINLELSNNTISGNSGSGISLGAFSNLTAILTNNLITGNGAGVTAFSDESGGTNLSLINNTITDNGVGVSASSHDYGNTTVDIINTIVSGNQATGSDNDVNLWENHGYGPATTTVNVSHSNIGNVVNGPSDPGTYNDLGNNMNADPLFVVPGEWDDNGTPADLSDDIWIEGDYHLQSGSPCIDNGTDAGAPDDDFEGDARPQGIGYDIGADEYIISFENGLPVDWSVIDNAGTGAVWRFDDPENRSNMTGGTGKFAIADSDFYGTGISMDTELLSSVIDMSNFSTVTLEFKSDFHAYSGNEIADVDVSVNGTGGPWTNVWKKTSDYRGPKTEAVDITAIAAGQSSVIARFHYYNANYDWFWEIDDVVFTGIPCNIAYYRDFDEDGYGDPNNSNLSCTQLAGYVLNSQDCDDTNGAINPDTLWYPDADGDGFGNASVAVPQCNQPTGAPDYVLDNTDCDDNDLNVYPGGPPVRAVKSGTTPAYHLTLQNAYDDPNTGDEHTIQIKAVTLNEIFDSNRDISITFIGGYDCSYSDIDGVTTIDGNMTVTNGTIILQEGVLEVK